MILPPSNSPSPAGHPLGAAGALGQAQPADGLHPQPCSSAVMSILNGGCIIYVIVMGGFHKKNIFYLFLFMIYPWIFQMFNILKSSI